MSGEVILVVEDHPPLLMAVQAILETEGFAVLAANDGLEALEIMEKRRPDLIVADIMMPRMDGYAFYEAVRARPEWVPIPFIFTTAKARPEDKLKGKVMGAEDYITKPFDYGDFVAAVRAKLRRAEHVHQVTASKFEELKQQVVDVLSHELRTPLTYIQGYTSLALTEVPSLSPEALTEFLTAIKRGADRLTAVADDLLLIMRLDAGQTLQDYRIMARTCDSVNDVVSGIVRKHEETAADRGVALNLKPAASLPPVTLCETLFEDALNRIIDNGLKFSQKQGKEVTVSTQARDGWVEIAVQDSGVGISAEELPLLFERFQQIDRGRLEQQGIGLGLPIAQGLIRLHDGEIVVESEPGAGSTFTIRLPVAED